MRQDKSMVATTASVVVTMGLLTLYLLASFLFLALMTQPAEAKRLVVATNPSGKMYLTDDPCPAAQGNPNMHSIQLVDNAGQPVELGGLPAYVW